MLHFILLFHDIYKKYDVTVTLFPVRIYHLKINIPSIRLVFMGYLLSDSEINVSTIAVHRLSLGLYVVSAIVIGFT